jgi:hypothetical protein
MRYDFSSADNSATAHSGEAGFAVVGEAQPDQLDLYQRTANSLRRLLEAIGLQRRSRDVTPDPLEYAARGERTS